MEDTYVLNTTEHVYMLNGILGADIHTGSHTGTDTICDMHTHIYTGVRK